jgi:hypothetical protein
MKGERMTPFEKFFIAHIVGDYLLQNDWMALHKGRKTPYGFKWQSLVSHSLLYGFPFLIAFMDIYVYIVVVFLHGIVDYFPVTSEWLGGIGGRTIEKAVSFPMHLPRNHASLYSSFTVLVYGWADFAIHFLITYPILYYFFL